MRAGAFLNGIRAVHLVGGTITPFAVASATVFFSKVSGTAYLDELIACTPDPVSEGQDSQICEVVGDRPLGALLYCATNCRPDIAFAVGLLCRAMAKPSPELLLAAEHVLSYLYRNRDVGLRYEAGEKPIEGYTDSDWGVRHSTTGYVFMYNQGAALLHPRRHATSTELGSSLCRARAVLEERALGSTRTGSA